LAHSAVSSLSSLEQFVLTADDSDRMPTLRNEEYRDYRLSKQEWERLQIIHEALRV
jgi:hypothetical protein